MKTNTPIRQQSNHEARRVQLYRRGHPWCENLPHDIVLLIADDSHAAHNPEEQEDGLLEN